MNSIFTRRSVRSYQNKPVEKEKIEKMLKAAMQAPSAGNGQPWEFIVVQDKERLQTLSKCSQYAKTVTTAPVSIVMLGNTANCRFPEYWQQDMGAATQNLLIQANELSLGAVWLGICPLQDRMDYISKMFSLPENVTPFAIVTVGYPESEDANYFLDRSTDDKIHYETY